MKISSSMQRYSLAIAICCAGIVLAWIFGEPSILLAAVAAVCSYGGRGPGLLSIGAFGLAFGLFFLIPGSDFPVEPKSYLRLAGFLAAALVIGLLIQDYQKPTSSHRAERESRLIVESMPGLGWSTDPSGNFIYVNPSVLDYVGKPSEALTRIGTSDSFGWEQVVHRDDVDRAVRAWLHCLRTGEPYESVHRVRRFDGTYRWFRAVGQPSRDPSGRVTGWYGTTIDIEDQKRAEEALRKSEQQLQLLIDTIPAMAWRRMAAGEPSYYNKRTLEYVGLSSEELGRSPFKVVHPDDFTALMRAWARSVETGRSFLFTYRLRRADGVYRWHEARAEPMRDQAGVVIQWYGVNVDVDDRQKAEEALRRSEQRLRTLIDTVPSLIWCATPEGEPSYINKRLMDYVGLTQEDLDTPGSTRLAGAIQAVVHPDDKAAMEKLLGHSFTTGVPFYMKYRMRRADGAYRWVDGRAEPLRDDNGRIVQWYGVCVDIDDETRVQEALRSAQDRLSRASQAASLAELSASIAHEVNQPLAAVVTNSHVCQRWLSADPPNIQRARVTSERIIRDAHSAAEVVSRIRALFKHTAQARASVNINDVIAEVCQLMMDEIAMKSIRIETDLGMNLPLAFIDRVQMQQVLVNLIRNGIDAMESTISGEKSLRICSRQDRTNMVLIEVRDQGCGIEDPERIFEPFFTTKDQGMGMGLAICRSIIESHDGRLWAAKNEPRGTTLSFTVPVRAGDPA